MKLLASTTLLFGALATGSIRTTSINVEKSVINWKGYKVLGSHTGTIQVKSGNLDWEDDKLIGGSFEIDMNTIACTDLEGEYAGKLVGHLKSDDFFGAAKYPMAKFEITNVVSRGKTGDYKVMGNLTIKESTQPVSFNAMVKDGMASGKMTIDRSKFNVRYGSGSFFDNLGDNTIYDEFDIEVNLVY